MNARYLDDDVTCCVRQLGETTTKIGASQNLQVSTYRDDCCHCFNNNSNKFIKTIIMLIITVAYAN
jgi:hypothetical protein